MVDVEVRNFQSIEHASIRVDGFTALVGKSNIGKSAFVRAVKAALTGAGGTSFVRHGPTCARRLKKTKTCDCFASVHIRTNGFDLKWEKGDKINRYTFNGQVYDRTAQGTPDFLLRPSLEQDFGSVEIARTQKLLQVADQFDNVFLLDQGGTAVADVLSDVARLDRINVAMRLVEKDRKDAAATRKVREKDVQSLTNRLAEFDGLDQAVGMVQQTENDLNKIAVAQSQVESLVGYIDDLRGLGFRIKELEKACNTAVPTPTEIVERHTSYERLTQFWLQAGEKASAIRALAGVEKIQDPEINPVEEKFDSFVRLEGWVAKLRSLQEVFAAAKPIEATKEPDTSTLKGAHDRYAQLASFVAKQDALIKAIQLLEEEDSKAAQEEKVVADECAALGVCPTCARSIEVGHKHVERHVA